MSSRSRPSIAAAACSRYSSRRRTAASNCASVTCTQRSSFVRTFAPYASACAGKSPSWDSATSRMNTGFSPSGNGKSTSLRRGKRSAAACNPGADERLGELEPGDPDLEFFQRAQRSAPEAWHERLQHPHARLDVAPHRPAVVVAGREREAAVERHEPEARLEADDAAARRRDPDRAARVGPERGVGEAGRQRGRGARARSAGAPVRRQRVRDVAEVRVRARDAVRELVQVGLADVRVAGALEARPPRRPCARARGRRTASSRRSCAARRCRRDPSPPAGCPPPHARVG